jgi:hypothetical protein
VACNALIGNGDTHIKNLSVIYRDRRTAALAPAYDFVSTVAYIPQHQTFALKFSRSKRYDELDLDVQIDDVPAPYRAVLADEASHQLFLLKGIESDLMHIVRTLSELSLKSAGPTLKTTVTPALSLRE